MHCERSRITTCLILLSVMLTAFSEWRMSLRQCVFTRDVSQLNACAGFLPQSWHGSDANPQPSRHHPVSNLRRPCIHPVITLLLPALTGRDNPRLQVTVIDNDTSAQARRAAVSVSTRRKREAASNNNV